LNFSEKARKMIVEFRSIYEEIKRCSPMNQQKWKQSPHPRKLSNLVVDALQWEEDQSPEIYWVSEFIFRASPDQSFELSGMAISWLWMFDLKGSWTNERTRTRVKEILNEFK
jgi:hypothetical protein